MMRCPQFEFIDRLGQARPLVALCDGGVSLQARRAGADAPSSSPSPAGALRALAAGLVVGAAEADVDVFVVAAGVAHERVGLGAPAGED